MKRTKVLDQLQRYRTKRNFIRTPEPSGRPAELRQTGHPVYVVQKHAATRLHYDFRLELDGTLKSWAVPKGPSLDPAQKRLAVHVEDHPLEYANFEGVIPPKQYGAGTVLIWDRGTWQPMGNPRESYRRGVMKFQLDGHKLHGAWTLVRMQHRRGDERENGKENWLLIKERDEAAKAGKDAEIVETQTDSVESGRSLPDVASQQPRVWDSHRSSSKPVPTVRRLTDVAKSSGRLNAPPHAVPSTRSSSALPGAVKAAQPDWIAPQLATLVDRIPSDGEWLHEIKYDGYRLLCRVSKGEVQFFTRNANDWTAKLQAQADAIAGLGLKDAWLDGEAVVFTNEGKTDFQALQNAFDSRFTGRIVYCVFDLLYLNGYDLRSTPLIERKRLLASLLTQPGVRTTDGLLRYSDHIVGDNQASFDEACRQGLEGLIVKQVSAIYRSGRGRSWLKVKCERRQEFVIGGFTEPAGARQGFGALLLGFYEDGQLRYAGRVGTGFSDRVLGNLYRTLIGIERSQPPFVNPPTGYDAKGAHWVTPKLVAEVRFAEWTKEGILRQPSFQGLRTDKPAREIVRERPTASTDVVSQHHPEARVAPKSSRKVRSRANLTHPDRVLYPDLGLTKEDLARYYEQVGEWILPHLRGRPLTLVRCPEGYQKCFYQKHVNEQMPQAIGRVEIEEDGDRATYMVADTLEAVLGLVQMGVLELHTWGATRDRLDRPNRLTFDLDPDPSVPWSQVVEASRLTKTLLEELDLACFLKTTGGKGLHLVVPIQRSCDWKEAKDFAKAVADHLVATIPQRFTSNMAKRARKGKIFIDYLRNARGATAIAAYSPRARPGAPVSVPIAWDELSADLTSEHFTIRNVPDRLTRLRRDPWKGYDESARRLTAGMKNRLAKPRG